MPVSRYLLLKNALRHPDVDAQIWFIHQLRDRDVPRKTDDLISLVPG
jgi:hypothetical protein